MTIFLKINNLFKSKDLRQLAENFFSLSVLKVVNLILPLVTLPYLIKVLGFHYYGAIILAFSLITYFQALTEYGFNLSATREIARHRHSQKQLSLIYNKTIWSKLVLLSGSLIFLFPLIIFVPQFKEDNIIFFLMCLMLVGNTMFPEWFFRGVERMWYITVLDLFVKILFTIGVFVFIHQPEDYWLYPLLFGCGYIASAILSYFIIYRNFSIKLRRVKIQQIESTLKKGFPLFINQFAPNFYNNTTNFLVGVLLGNSAVGLFGAIRQIINILSVVNSIISTTLFPFLIRKPEKFNTISVFYITFFIFFISLVALFHDYVIKLLGINSDISIIFYILLSGVMCTVFYSLYATNYLISRGYDAVVMRVTVFVSIIGLLLAYPLIINYELIGAALVIFFCQFLLGLYSFIFYIKLCINKEEMKFK